MNRSCAPTRTGADRLRADPSLVSGSRIGLVTNYTGVTADLDTTVAGLMGAGVPIVALFGPEHGLRGTTQAGYSESGDHDRDSGLPLYDTYRHSGADLDALLERSGVDTLLYDLQDIGSRFYTYVWTMYDLLTSAARTGVRFVVLDRPNPIGGLAVEGPLLDTDFTSFVGRAPIPLRHGLTVGELARFLNNTAVPVEAGRPAELAVVDLADWDRSMFADETGLPWVMPSVNMPTLDSALAYPGTGLFEGTNLSEGRGTTRPFELIGAPYVDGRWARELNARKLPGVRFRDVSFTPTFHKHADSTVRGVQLHVTDRLVFTPVACALAMLYSLRRLYPGEFGWRAYDDGAERTAHRFPVDLLWGSDSLRRIIDAGEDPATLLQSSMMDSPRDWAGDGVLLYQ
ncbi:MAG: exo-beta-N-acetylmuramidase NamZ family protein [Stackebrandtia sp.]